MGRPASRRWWRRDAFADRLARRAPDLDQVIVALEEPPARALAQTPDNRPFKEKWRGQIQGCLVAVALCAITTLIAMQWLVTFDAANLVMLYLLGVVVIALLYGRWPSVVATVINVASFDLFFIAPRGTLAVSDVQYLLTFAVMLTVGLVIGNLTAGVRYQARVARYRNSVPVIYMKCLKRWPSGVANMISPRPASGLSPRRFRRAAKFYYLMLTVSCCLSPTSKA